MTFNSRRNDSNIRVNKKKSRYNIILDDSFVNSSTTQEENLEPEIITSAKNIRKELLSKWQSCWVHGFPFREGNTCSACEVKELFNKASREGIIDKVDDVMLIMIDDCTKYRVVSDEALGRGNSEGSEIAENVFLDIIRRIKSIHGEAAQEVVEKIALTTSKGVQIGREYADQMTKGLNEFSEKMRKMIEDNPDHKADLEEYLDKELSQVLSQLDHLTGITSVKGP